MSVEEALCEFVSHYQKSYPRLEEAFDPQWRSPCELGSPFTGEDGVERILWQPLKCHPDTIAADFSGIERALELAIHPDIKSYYGTFFSGGLEAEAPDGHVSLILLWNHEDYERLTKNLIGHALAKRQVKSPLTVFFACTETDSDLFLSIDNESGAILLEKPGAKPLRQVADSMAVFLDELVPAPPEDHPERVWLR